MELDIRCESRKGRRSEKEISGSKTTDVVLRLNQTTLAGSGNSGWDGC